MITIEYLRSFRLGEYSIFDLSTAFLGMWLISPLLSKIFRLIKLDIPKISWIFFTLPIGIFAHILTNQNTRMTGYIFDARSHYLLKLVIIGSLILGLLRIKIIKKR